MGIQRVRQYQSLGMLDDPQSWIRKHLSDHAAEASLRIQDFDHNRLANLHQDVTTTASPTLVGLTLSGLTASKPVFTNASKALVSTGTLAVDQGGTGLTALGTANQILGGNAGATALEYKTLTGTANRVTVTHAAGSITLSGPQDIATTSSPSFYGLTIAQQNSTPGLTIKNAATFDPAYPPLAFQDSTGTYVGGLYINSNYDIIGGYEAGLNISPGSYGANIIQGYMAGYSLRNATWNVALGGLALYGSWSGADNTAVGSDTLNAMLGGDSNVAIGDAAGLGFGYPYRTISIGRRANYTSMADLPSGALAAGTDLGIGLYYYVVSFVFGASEGGVGWPMQITTTTGKRDVNLSAIPTYSGPFTCTARKVYRSKVGDGSKLYLLTTIGDNTTTIYSDVTADGALGAQLTPGLPANTIAIGTDTFAFLSQTAVIGGGAGSEITDFYLNGYYAASPVGATLHSQGGSGANVTGADFTIAPGQGTGTGAGGSFKIKVAPAGAAGSTWNALEDALVIDSTKTITTGIWGATVIGASKGGTGIDSSAWTGYPITAAGTWSQDTQLAWSSGVLTLQTTNGTNTDTNLTIKGKGTGDGIITLYGGGATYYHIIQGSNAEGVVNTADLRIGLDESLRALILCDRGDIDTDFGLTPAASPTFIIYAGDLGSNLKITSGSITKSANDIDLYARSVTLNHTGTQYIKQNGDIASGDAVSITQGSAAQELTDTDGRQSGVSIIHEFAQSGTAALDALYVNPTLTSVGTGATGDGNNLLRLAVSGTTAIRWDCYGHAHGGEFASLADTSVLTTNIANTWNGFAFVTCSDNVTASYRVEAGTLVVMSVNAAFGLIQGVDTLWNVYFNANVLKVENQRGSTLTAKVLFMGH